MTALAIQQPGTSAWGIGVHAVLHLQYLIEVAASNKVHHHQPSSGSDINLPIANLAVIPLTAD